MRAFPGTIPAMWMTRLVIALAVVLLPGLMLAPVWHNAGLGAGEDDILYYFPARTFFHDTIQAGHWPWLNPWTGLGRPFVADPQTAFWYPTTWLFAVLPPLWAYPASLWIHYSLALWGMYLLLRLTPLSRHAALFGGVAFAFSGFMLAHRAHFTMQHAAAWTPWVFWSLARLARAQFSVRRLVVAVVFLALFRRPRADRGPDAGRRAGMAAELTGRAQAAGEGGARLAAVDRRLVARGRGRCRLVRHPVDADLRLPAAMYPRPAYL
jgi:hypothetical protein